MWLIRGDTHPTKKYRSPGFSKSQKIPNIKKYCKKSLSSSIIFFGFGIFKDFGFGINCGKNPETPGFWIPKKSQPEAFRRRYNDEFQAEHILQVLDE